MDRGLWLAVAAVLLGACVAHEKNGDRAAALGDWKTAYSEYREAISKEPDSPALKDKLQRSRREASTAAFRKAQSCSTSGDWSCAVTESQFALELDESNQEIARFKAEAARGLVRSHLRGARAAASQGQFNTAFESLKAAASSSDPELAGEIAAARSEVVARAEAEGDRLHQAKSYKEALGIFQMVVALDGSKRPKLEAVQRDYDVFLDAEYERHARQGDEALSGKRWAEAESHYRAALNARAGGRVAPLAQYAGGIAKGEAALAARDFTNATEGYRQALGSGMDRDGYAAGQLRRVEVRPYVIRIRSVLAKPTKPDGVSPWVGDTNPIFKAFVVGVAASYGGVAGGKVAANTIDALDKMPEKNRPNLSVIATLPDGRKLTTAQRRNLYVVYDSKLVVATNFFDERKLSFRVIHSEGISTTDVGVIDVALKDLLEKKDATWESQSIAALQLSAEVAEGMADGMFAEMSPVTEGQGAAAASEQTATSAGFRLASVEVQAVAGDYKNEMGVDGAPDLQVEIQQAGRVVYQSPKAQDQYEARWSPPAVFLFVEPSEQLIVRVWDIDAADNDQILAAYVSAAALASGQFVFATPRQSWVRLRFEPRASGLVSGIR